MRMRRELEGRQGIEEQKEERESRKSKRGHENSWGGGGGLLAVNVGYRERDK